MEEEEEEEEENEAEKEEKRNVSSGWLKSIETIRSTCKKQKLEPPSGEKVQRAADTLSSFFTERRSKGIYSKDNQFRLVNDKNIIWQKENDPNKKIHFPILKLLATLSLKTKTLLGFLKQHYPRPYSSMERKFIKILVRASQFPTSSIPCIKVRKLCV